MEELQRAIEKISYYCERLPKKELDLISENRDAAIPYLRGAVEKVLREKDNPDQEYSLQFYGIYLLAQFQDREFFPKLMELALLPEDTLDILIGDTLTECLKDILYNTYNGDLELLIQSVWNKEASDYARVAMLDVIGQLYLDQKLGRQELQDFLRQIIYQEESIGDYIYTRVAQLIYRCHFTDMLPELKRLYQDGRVDRCAIGGYDSCVDQMFSYRKRNERFCKSPVKAWKMINGWAEFEYYDETEMVDEDKSEEEKEESREIEEFFRELNSREDKTEQRRNVKIGRNDPCPCGSGKKYKHCCLNKPKLAEQGLESAEEQEKWLREYPPAAVDRKEGRVYLEDLYSKEIIEIDKLLYLALKHRVIPIWKREPEQVVANRKRRYLTDAFLKFQEFVEREQIHSFLEYDSKYSIHYPCTQWFDELLELLKEDDRDGILENVRSTFNNMEMQQTD
ncbi:MAG: DUF1186 domain-containing protein [Lachnospiraceae bacterium]|nr:DUF1186 domain-containing protein [Lachnospiraceae bacterium]MDE7271839.1 DUF1186 domain-containing protein [Lachnospiraceae bacterium]